MQTHFIIYIITNYIQNFPYIKTQNFYVKYQFTYFCTAFFMIWEAHFQVFMATVVQMMIIFYTFTCRNQMSWCFKRMFCLQLQGDWTASTGWTRSFTLLQMDKPIQLPWIKAVHSSKLSEHSTTTWCKNPKDHQDQKLLVYCMKFNMNTEIIKVLAVTSNCLKMIRCNNKEVVAKLRQTVTNIVSIHCVQMSLIH